MSGPWEKYNGIVELGNIDLNARPVVKNDDGSISTVRSMGVNMDGVEVLIPTVSDDGRLMSDQEAINTYRKTGRHLGKFKSVADSNAYAESLHQQQEKQYGGNEGPWSKYAAPAAVSAGKEINSIPRQLGLTARYGIEGVGNAAQIVSEPIRYLTDRLTGSTGKTVPAGVLATRLADTLGLPSPQGANERTIAEGTKMLAGAGGMGGVASLGRAAPGLAGEAARLLSSNMPQQLGSAAGAGLAGGASREAGGGTGMQTLAALGGGVVGGLVPGGVTSLVNTLKSTVNKLTPQQMDQQISAVLQRAEVDYSALPQGVRNSLRNELKSALQAGKELDPAAVARLADFKAVGATPTRGMVSQNPVQITREMNLAKIGANSSDDTLQGLPMIQNQNNNTLIRRLNEGGAAQGDTFRAGQTAIDSIAARDAALESGVSSLYKTARDTQGRSLPLDHVAFTTRANQALDEAMVGGALPADVANTMNKIAKGEIPLTVEIAEQIKTRIGALQRATNDGSARMALGTVRRALDDTPLLQAQQAVPGQQSIDAFNQARNAARQRFGWQESGRPIEAALNGAQPDRFVQQFVIGGTLDDAKAIAQNAPIGEVKNAILAHLKDKALNGAADEVGKFSQSAFNKAVNQIGERKLALFFSPQELAELKAVGRVASYMQSQPVGSAVNNSNSGALLLGRGLDLANRIPVVGPMLVPPLKNIEIAVRNSQARNVAPSLLMQQPTPTIGQNLLLPGLALGGSLAAP